LLEGDFFEPKKTRETCVSLVVEV